MFIYPQKPICHLNIPSKVEKTPLGGELKQQVHQAFSHITKQEDGLRHFVVDINKYGDCSFKLVDNDAIRHGLFFNLEDFLKKFKLQDIRNHTETIYDALKQINEAQRTLDNTFKPRRFLGFF